MPAGDGVRVVGIVVAQLAQRYGQLASCAIGNALVLEGGRFALLWSSSRRARRRGDCALYGRGLTQEPPREETHQKSLAI